MGGVRTVKEDLGRVPLATLNGGLASLVVDAYQTACHRSGVAPDLFMYASITGETALGKIRMGQSVSFPLDRGQEFGVEVRSGGYVVPYVRRASPQERSYYDPCLRMQPAVQYVDGS